MPLITDTQPDPPTARRTSQSHINARKQSQHSIFAKSVLMSRASPSRFESTGDTRNGSGGEVLPPQIVTNPPTPAATSSPTSAPSALPNPSVQSAKAQDGVPVKTELKPIPAHVIGQHGHIVGKDGVGGALTDTPMPSAPGSPRM